MKRLGLLMIVMMSTAAGSCGGDEGQKVPPYTTVTITMNAYPDLGFTGDGCADLGVSTMKVDVVGPETKSMSAGCTDKQVVFVGLEPGDYQGTLTPLGGDGASLVKAPIAFALTATDAASTTTVNVPWESWTQGYTGTFYYKITWGGHAWAMAQPPVVSQVVTVSQGGTPTSLTDDKGHKVNGVDGSPCRDGDQFVAKLPFGPTTIHVAGKDSGGTIRYEKQFEAFNGAGTFNPTVPYDLPGPPDAMPPDAGVDAMPDAMPDAL